MQLYCFESIRKKILFLEIHIKVFSIFTETGLSEKYELILNNMEKIYRWFRSIILVMALLMVFPVYLSAQNKIDSLTNDLKAEIYKKLKHFTFGFYVDAYYNGTINSKSDTSNVVPFASNCPVQNESRMNVAAIEIGYTADKVRGMLAIQFGDAPNLLASPQSEFIKTLRQANFGFHISKKLWLDFGYFLNPVGLESTWPVLNDLSTVSIGGYYEPGNVLGIKLTWNASDKFWGGLMLGNPYSLAYGKNTHMAILIFVYYQPIPRLTLNYNNIFGNQALKNAQIKNDILYNNFIITYNPVDPLSFTGQLDFAAQTNSQMTPDTNKIATMFSGLIEAKYVFLTKFAVIGRYEFFNDYDGFLSGLYFYNNRRRGLLTQGFSIGFEYKPVKIGYLRLEYKHLYADPGNNIFTSRERDQLQSIVFTTGVRF